MKVCLKKWVAFMVFVYIMDNIVRKSFTFIIVK